MPSRWPAEWEPQQMAFLGFPSRGDWYRDGGEYAQQEICEVARILSQYQAVTICTNPEQAYHLDDILCLTHAKAAKARSMVSGKVQVLEVSYETPYIRDTSPLFVIKDGRLTAVDWGFNVYGGMQKEDGSWVSKWGSLYATDLKDARVAQVLAEHMKVPVVRSKIILEGGSVHTDGEGTLVTTAECLLNKNRNPSMSKQEIEAELDRQLGIKKVLWLPKGVHEDWATNHHVDNFCCFVRPGAVLLAWTDDRSDPQYEACQQALELLESTPDAQGRKLQVHKVYLPPNLFLSEAEAAAMVGEKLKRRAGDRLPASYINFYRGNGCAVIPAFGQPTDEPAMKAIQAAFGESVKVYSTPAREILCGGGNIHCMSMQMAQAVEE